MNTNPATSAALTLDTMRAEIARIIHESPQDIGLDDNLMDWGLDSLRLLNLITEWNRTGLQLDISELAGQLTLNAMWQVISKRQART
ncbi:MAG: phosphopantetheine-binding protein [Candidatus Dactylopiibacterium carminicum]|uniref:Phosphopantetheine-binding protein n=1 Tax=Candidatus Dactylopiibacterium carminicum TaxID=857335 RepID=A0A272EXU2_9RHOO|nr:phosphopantetheine-binding protein [Candidatus Dactylopiibacterium carminicum]KAF7600494.1 phosphopantetheine-binding protein [Candidatus Dactylopiibacterium carminicum]PAS94938.1 MAG: phosphopantetheine-binding protein [Candidatus Dactylopiibacterium carminicum]PAS98073.1 MAG: phosphopantetheine-binding protein [Candidatus Dactylopiibacterium carminicum]PAT00498.1 MAG: phosphopantetheine-binding protein [Candidatus Dactylopiibacterium carminicum]